MIAHCESHLTIYYHYLYINLLQLEYPCVYELWGGTFLSLYMEMALNIY